MIARFLGVALMVCAAFSAEAATTLRIAYVSQEDDPAYAVQKSYTGLILREKKPPVDGARAAIRESRAIGRATGMAFELVEVVVGKTEGITEAVVAQQAGGINIFILDLPIEDVVALGERFAGDPAIILFNVRHRADVLRGALCAPAYFHTIASDAMLNDALAQYLFAQNWRNVLVLTSQSSADLASAEAFMASAHKFGLKVVDTRRYILSNDPREREQNNLRLLTGDAGYDAVFIADAAGEFGRYVPFATALPRPVVGAEGLIASSWHWTFERHGAPQLNQRIRRQSDREPTSEDWATWAAVRSVVEASVQAGSIDGAVLRKRMLADDFRLDLYKIGAGSYRSWDHQLRQPIMLHTHNAVIAVAPVEGFLHQFHAFDSLGTDEPESQCRLAAP